MHEMQRAISALCGTSETDEDLLLHLGQRGLCLAKFVPSHDATDARTAHALQVAARHGFVVIDAAGRLQGHLVPQVGRRHLEKPPRPTAQAEA